jgi:hypothetical protein
MAAAGRNSSANSIGITSGDLKHLNFTLHEVLLDALSTD